MPFSAFDRAFLDKAHPSPPALIDVLVLTDTVCAGLAHISAESFSCFGYFCFPDKAKS